MHWSHVIILASWKNTLTSPGVFLCLRFRGVRAIIMTIIRQLWSFTHARLVRIGKSFAMVFVNGICFFETTTISMNIIVSSLGFQHSAINVQEDSCVGNSNNILIEAADIQCLTILMYAFLYAIFIFSPPLNLFFRDTVSLLLNYLPRLPIVVTL